MEGKTLPEVWVKAIGPVEREGPTVASGNVMFSNVNAGSYRLRFEHEGFVTLEREFTITPGRPLKASVSLNAAPPPPPPPKVEAPSPPPTPTPAPLGDYRSVSVDIPDFFEKNYIGSAQVKRSPVACTASTASMLVQLKEPIAEHTHGDADELIYVVGGEGTHKVGGREYPLSSGVFTVVPRGVSHSIVRRGRLPLVFISTLSGPPCQPEK
jgi:hypothetical protein